MNAAARASGTFPHIPVLYHEVLSVLQPGTGTRYVDGTLGAGGHAYGLMQHSAADTQLLGIDQDAAALQIARTRLADFGARVHYRQGNYTSMIGFAHELGWQEVDGILLDLGVSSMQLDSAVRGFSFREDGPLDMRLGDRQHLTAADVVNGYSEADLADLIWRYGDERRSRQIARTIVTQRPFQGTQQLAAAISMVVYHKPGAIHPATRTFQAIRIAVNDELQSLEVGLKAGLDLLRPGGRMAVISFHSLEDRIVKHYFRRESVDCVCPPERPVCACGHKAVVRRITKKPLRPTDEEIAENPRARSSRLRAIEKL